jgi:hypothetical protein
MQHQLSVTRLLLSGNLRVRPGAGTARCRQRMHDRLFCESVTNSADARSPRSFQAIAIYSHCLWQRLPRCVRSWHLSPLEATSRDQAATRSRRRQAQA